jgi:hypothetical protein
LARLQAAHVYWNSVNHLPYFTEAAFFIVLLQYRCLDLIFENSPALIMVADALIYHPSIAHYLRYVATTGLPSNAHLSGQH